MNLSGLSPNGRRGRSEGREEEYHVGGANSVAGPVPRGRICGWIEIRWRRLSPQAVTPPPSHILSFHNAVDK